VKPPPPLVVAVRTHKRAQTAAAKPQASSKNAADVLLALNKP
jgi:hypothetical protein